MASVGEEAEPTPPTVFLSYASEDRPAARRIGDALPAYGLEVWYDESELGGGDAWDQKIRRQIRECDFFIALVSAHTEARHEGYFRREWRLAVERTLDMADDHMFLLPIVIDDTDQSRARVPEKFLAVQWLKVPGGEPTPAFESLCRKLGAGGGAAAPGAKKTARPAVQGAAIAYPEFPREEPGQRVRFWFDVVGWALRSGWLHFKRLPRWVRILVYVWLGVVLLSKGCTTSNHSSRVAPVEDAHRSRPAAESEGLPPQLPDAAKLGRDASKLGEEITREVSKEVAGEVPKEVAGKGPAQSPLLVIPFRAPDGDAAARTLAEKVFAQVFKRVTATHRGQVGLLVEPHPSADLTSALESARSRHSTYVIYGMVESDDGENILDVKIVAAADGSVKWSKSYPAADANPKRIAQEIDSEIPSLDEDD